MPARTRFRVPDDVVGRPAGLLGLWRLRHSFVYRFERLRLAGRHGPVRRLARPAAAAGLFLLAAVASLLLPGADEIVQLGPGLLQTVLLLGVLVGMCGAGTRVFAGERANATLDALVMAPVARYGLVAGRLLARLRVYLSLLLLFIAVQIACGTVNRLAGPAGSAGPAFRSLGPGVLVQVVVSAAGWLYYLSFAALGSTLGLVLGVRMRSAGWALVATLAILLGVLVAENILLGVGFALLGFLLFAGGPGSPAGLASFFLAMALAQLIVFGASSAMHLLLARSFVNRAARRFDRWALGKDA